MESKIRLYANGFTPKLQKRVRQQFRFDLDLNKVNELEIAQWFNSLKKARQFKRILMDAIALFIDLSNGNLNILYELFPGIVHTIEQNHQVNAIEDLRGDIAALTERLLEHNIPMPKLRTSPSGLAEDRVELVAEKSNVSAAENFLKNMGELWS